jgi:hypothetical protein
LWHEIKQSWCALCDLKTQNLLFNLWFSVNIAAPLAANIEPTTQTVDFGRPAVFTCNFEGNPIKMISWLKDGKSLSHEDSVLRIESVKKEDKGMYQCFIRNDQENAQASAELKLGGRCELFVHKYDLHEFLVNVIILLLFFFFKLICSVKTKDTILIKQKN